MYCLWISPGCTVILHHVSSGSYKWTRSGLMSLCCVWKSNSFMLNLPLAGRGSVVTRGQTGPLSCHFHTSSSFDHGVCRSKTRGTQPESRSSWPESRSAWNRQEVVKIGATLKYDDMKHWWRQCVQFSSILLRFDDLCDTETVKKG